MLGVKTHFTVANDAAYPMFVGYFRRLVLVKDAVIEDATTIDIGVATTMVYPFVSIFLLSIVVVTSMDAFIKGF